MKTAVLIAVLFLSGCYARVVQQPIYLESTGIWCDAAIMNPGIPIADSTMEFAACRDLKTGQFIVTQGMAPTNPITNLAGGASGVMSGAAQAGSMMGGF